MLCNLNDEDVADFIGIVIKIMSLINYRSRHD